MEQYLRCIINYQQDDWTDLLFLVEFAYNNTLHSSTKQTPFFSNYGHHPQADSFQVKDVGGSLVKDLAIHLVAIHDAFAFQFYEVQDRYKDYADCNWKLYPNFHSGDHVWHLRWNTQTKRPSRKLDYQQLGPFKIITQVNLVSYCLELPPTMYYYTLSFSYFFIGTL